jgi:hypothetical protein
MTLFDFAAISVAMHLPFERTPEDLQRLAGSLSDSALSIRTARQLIEPLHQQLLPAIIKPLWQDDLSEEYFLFQFQPGQGPRPEYLRDQGAAWLASLVRLDAGPLSPAEVAEAIHLHLSYSPDDLFVPDWAAAVLLDKDCEETLRTVEFANLQLLEYRHIDDRLDQALQAASRLTVRAERSLLPFLRSYGRPLRTLGELKVEANGLFERTGNALKLLGDQYLARIYRLVAARFHLKEWERSIARKLEVAEGVYRVVSDEAVTYRMEFLEIIVIILITLEIVLALFKH